VLKGQHELNDEAINVSQTGGGYSLSLSLSSGNSEKRSCTHALKVRRRERRGKTGKQTNNMFIFISSFFFL